MQRQRHGVQKKLVEGAGGVLVGVALVLLARGLMKRRAKSEPAEKQLPEPSQKAREIEA